MFKNVLIGVLVVLLIVVGMKLTTGTTAGGTTNFDSVTITPTSSGEGLVIGANGGVVAELKATTCDFITAGGVSQSLPASTTKVWDCAVAGVSAGDVVFVTMPTTTPSTGTGVTVMANASTTAGYVTFRVSNGAGAAITLGPTTIGSSTQVLYIDN